jgi:hypothetical protein
MLDAINQFVSGNYCSKNLEKYILGENITKKEREFKNIFNYKVNYFNFIYDFAQFTKSQENKFLKVFYREMNTMKINYDKNKNLICLMIYAIYQCRKNIHDKILICSSSNTSADSIALDLLRLQEHVKKFNLLRIYAKNQESNPKVVHHVKYNSIDKNKSQSKNMNLNSNFINNNNNTTNINTNVTTNNNINNFLDIKVSNSVLKKDITGKPFLDYICDVKNGNENYSLNKKFGHFIMLHKALKSLFKDTIKLPDGGNLFMSINDMKQNSFHENKLSQLDKYINDLMKFEQIKMSVPFRNFFELDEVHEQSMNNKIKKNKTMMEKKKYDQKYSSNSNNVYQKSVNDNNTNELMNFK